MVFEPREYLQDLFSKEPSKKYRNSRPNHRRDEIDDGEFYRTITRKPDTYGDYCPHSIHITLDKYDRPAIFLQQQMCECKLATLFGEFLLDIGFVKSSKIKVDLVAHKATKTCHNDSKNDIHVSCMRSNPCKDKPKLTF